MKNYSFSEIFLLTKVHELLKELAEENLILKCNIIIRMWD